MAAETHSTRSNFLAGWHTLPDELELHVLGFALPSNHEFHAVHFSSSPVSHPLIGPRMPQMATSYRLFEESFMPLLAVPELSAMAREVLYKQNTITMPQDCFGGGGLPFSRPLTSVAAFVHRLKVHIRPSAISVLA